MVKKNAFKILTDEYMSGVMLLIGYQSELTADYSHTVETTYSDQKAWDRIIPLQMLFK